MRTLVLSLAALAATAATADAQFGRRNVVYAPGYFYTPQYVVPGTPTVVAPAAADVLVPAPGGVVMSATPTTVVLPAAPAVVGWGYYPAYRYGSWRWR